MLAPTGTDLDPTDVTIRQRHARRDDRFRPLVHAAAEDEKARAGENVDGLWWFVVPERRLVATRPEEADLGDDTVLPVLTHHGEGAGEASVDDTCPSCAQKDGIRFLGSAIATLLSVTLSGLFGTSGLDIAEKKALVFTDSVQDAAHRAGSSRRGRTASPCAPSCARPSATNRPTSRRSPARSSTSRVTTRTRAIASCRPHTPSATSSHRSGRRRPCPRRRTRHASASRRGSCST
ncbi:hypothetical protein NKG05_10925 [Oerskovia sp. M15]